VDDWLYNALAAFVEDFSLVAGGAAWLACVESSWASLAVDSLDLLGVVAKALEPTETAALWSLDDVKVPPPPGLEPPPGFKPVVAWPPRGSRLKEMPAAADTFSVVLLGPTKDPSPENLRRLVVYSRLGRHLKGLLTVGSEHGVVALSSVAAGWLLTARVPTAGVGAIMLDMRR
jgi:hypothetical protein